MAGIGFRLHRLVQGESLTELFAAYLYSAVITTGPMLVIIAMVAGIRGALHTQLDETQAQLLLGIVIYVYAFSLVSVAPVQYVVTRYLSDLYYRKRFEEFAPTFLAVLAFTIVCAAPFVLTYLYWTPWPLAIKLLVWIAFNSVIGIWLAMLFLSAAHSFQWIFWAFVTGGIVTVLAAWQAGYWLGFIGCIAGFTVGQAVTFLMLVARIIREFGISAAPNFGFLHYFRIHPRLAFVGWIYTIGLWSDKLLFWFGSTGDTIGGGSIRVCFLYDTPMFFAFLTAIPSLAFFLVQMETRFARSYWNYFRMIRERKPLTDLRAAATHMRRTLYQQLQRFVLLQGCISALAIFFVEDFAQALHLQSDQLGILRIGILGAFVHVGFLFVLTYLFYFDWQTDALWLCVLFAVANLLGTAATLYAGLPAYGYGYMFAALITASVGAWRLVHKIDHILYWTFMTQPIVPPALKLEGIP